MITALFLLSVGVALILAGVLCLGYQAGRAAAEREASWTISTLRNALREAQNVRQSGPRN